MEQNLENFAARRGLGIPQMFTNNWASNEIGPRACSDKESCNLALMLSCFVTGERHHSIILP